MSKEDLHQTEEEDNSTPPDGSEDKDMSDEEFNKTLAGMDDDSDDSDDSKEEDDDDKSEDSDDDDKSDTKEGEDSSKFLEQYNEEFGTTYKSIDDAKAGHKNLRKKASNDGRKAKSDAKDTRDYSDDILGMKYPDSQFVLDELKAESERTGNNVLDIYKESTYFQNEAAARSAEKSEDAENDNKVNKPNGKVGNTGSVDINRMNPKQFKEYKNKVLSRR